MSLFGISMSKSWLREGEEDKTYPSDVQTHIAELLKSEGLDAERRSEVLGALEIDEVSVSHMVPREEMACLSIRESLVENLKVIRKQIRSRYPLIGDSADEFLGIIPKNSWHI